MVEEGCRHRVFVIGTGLLLPYQSQVDQFVRTSPELEQIMFDDPDGSLIGELPEVRRDLLQPDEGRILGNYFSVSSYEGLLTLVKGTIPTKSWRPRRIKTPEEALATCVALSALENSGIHPGLFEADTPWLPKGERGSSRPLLVAVGMQNSIGPGVFADIIRYPLDRNPKIRFLRGGLSGLANVAILEATNSCGPPILHQGACAGAGINVASAYHMLTHEIEGVDLSIVGGYEIASATEIFYTLGQSGAAAPYERFRDDPREACRPGSIDASGLVMTEGGWACVLATEATINRLAIPREKIRAEIIGVATGQDAARLVPPKDPRELVRVMKGSLEEAGLSFNQLDLLIEHGTGTGDGDRHDAAAAREVASLPVRDYQAKPDNYHQQLPDKTLPKSRTGHNLFGSFGLSSEVAFQAMERDEIPATRNITRPNGMQFNLVFRANKKRKVRYAQVNAVGMDGTVVSVVYAKPPQNTFPA